MATGASNADLAVILIDARKGVLTQTERHSYICSLLGIRHVVVAVNKIDLVDFDQDVFDRIVGDYVDLRRRSSASAPSCRCRSPRASATTSPRASGNMPWYRGPTLLEHLETVDVDAGPARRKPFRFPVQWVNRPNLDFRGFAGTIASGPHRAGRPGRRRGLGQGVSRIARIVTADGDLRSRRRRRGGDADAGRRDRRRARRHARPPADAARRSPTSSPPISLDGRGGAAAGPLLPDAHRQSSGRRARSPRSSTGST